jgi:hypothetical protein
LRKAAIKYLRESPVPFPVASYLTKRGVGDRWALHAVPDRFFFGAVVIPALAEFYNLPQTLETISRNPDHLLHDFLLLIVVNQRADASDAETADNQETLRSLPHWKQQYRLPNMFWIDAASSGLELPHKQGVGLARKIGMDLALKQLDFSSGDPLLICLDADTLVQPDYLAAISSHFAATTAGGASIPYRHRPASDQVGQSAIDRYELFLRTYVLGLQLAASPYAFHTVGSAMACRASAYVASGGMNRRQAGEDFYFLQQLFKTSGVADLSGTIVHPSPRASDRVPFGTGRSVGDMLADGEQRLLFYQPVVFSIVREWLSCLKEHCGEDSVQLLKRAALISPVLCNYLVQIGFKDAWSNLQKNNREKATLLAAFHGWFDAFRTMRFIHELSDQAHPRIPPEEAVTQLLEYAGLPTPESISGQLALLRRMQGATVNPDGLN